MKKFQIFKLQNEKFDYLIIATSYENPLSNLSLIRNEIDVDQANILFDLTLLNGVKSNRYISCKYYSWEKQLQSCSIENNLDESIKILSQRFFMDNEQIIQNSVIPNSLKFLIKSGMV